MQNIQDMVKELQDLHNKGVPAKSVKFKELFNELKKKSNEYYSDVEIAHVISYVAMNCHFFFNSKKCFNFLHLLDEYNYLLFLSYTEISYLVGKRMNKKFGRCETFIGWLEGQDIIQVYEMGKTKGKKCIVFLSPEIVKRIIK